MKTEQKQMWSKVSSSSTAQYLRHERPESDCEQRTDASGPLFLNTHGRRLSRSGVAYILRKLVTRAGITAKHATRVTPHVIRRHPRILSLGNAT